MKKIHLILVAMFVLAIAAILFINPSKAVSQQKTSQTAYSIPDDVAKILKNSCTSCHDNGGNGMAESMWSFSSWGNYSVKKQASKANAICNALTKGSMPPGSFSSSNPDKVPTAAQKDIVCKWAASLKVK
jgi:cytochrome c5